MPADLTMRWACSHADCHALETCATAVEAHEAVTGHRMRVAGERPAPAPVTDAQLDAAGRAYLRHSHARNVNWAGLRAALAHDRATRPTTAAPDA